MNRTVNRIVICPVAALKVPAADDLSRLSDPDLKQSTLASSHSRNSSRSFMNQRFAQHPRSLLTLAASCVVLASLTACGGSGSGFTGTGPDADLGKDFELVKFGTDEGGSLTNFTTWKINRPIEMSFNQPVDFSTVDFNSISVFNQAGEPALGEFRVKTDAFGELIPEVIIFQPRCPVQPDLSDAGLKPGGDQYQIVVIGKDINQGIAVRSQSGKVLVESQQRIFFTPLSTLASEIFFDVVPGSSAEPLVQDEDMTKPVSSRIELLDEAGGGFVVPTVMEFQVVNGAPTVIQEIPINLYSQSAQDVSVVLEFNQPVNPSESNVNSNRLQLQYFDTEANVWRKLPTDVVLEENCTASGARARLTPIGILPQASIFRVFISNAFEDLIGTPNTAVQNNFASFETTSLQNPPSFEDPGALGDEIFLPFDIPAGQTGSFEQESPDFAEPLAIWENGQLRAGFEFAGTGGPDGNFDWSVPPGTTFIFNTEKQTIFGGPNFSTSKEFNVLDGVLQVRNLRVPADSRLRAIGINPLIILATGTVEILGEITVDGAAGPDVGQLSVPNIAKQGAPSNCGGGRGGAASQITNSSTPKGGQGFGAFNQTGGGGLGGETSYLATMNEINRQGAGGGGGGFANVDAAGNNVSAQPGQDGSAPAAPRDHASRSGIRSPTPDRTSSRGPRRAAAGEVAGCLQVAPERSGQLTVMS